MTISADYRPAIATTANTVRVELDGWAAGGADDLGVIDDQGTRWRITGFYGWHGAPAVRTSFTDRPGEHGAFDGPAFITQRVVVIEGVAVASSLADAFRARDIVSSVCVDTSALTTFTVVESGRPTMQAAVRRVDETKTSDVSDKTFTWSVMVVAPDPRRYAASASSQSTGLAAPSSGGLVFPLVFPLVFGGGAAGGEVDCINNGTVAVFPTFTIAGPITGPIIRNLTTGQRLEFDPTFSVGAGESLIIDTDARTVYQGTTSRRDKLFTAQWFKLDPGTTTLRFDSVGSYDPATQLTVDWRDGWI